MKNNRNFIAHLLMVTIALSLTACAKKNDNAGNSGSGSSTTVLEPPAPAPAPAPAQQQSSSVKPDPNYPIANYVNLTSGNQLMFLYYALSGMPPDYSKISQLYSQDYRNTSDAFKKQDILKALTPQIDAAISAAKNQHYFIWEADYTPISHYDFSKKSYSINSPYFQSASASGYFGDNNGYKIKFENGTDFVSLPVPDENLAKAIESRVSKSEAFNIKIYCFAQNADPSDDSINAVITRVELLTQNGIVLASYPAK